MGTFANGFHCYVSLPPHKKKRMADFLQTKHSKLAFSCHPSFGAVFCSRSEAYSQFPCMSHNSRGKGQRVAIRWMRHPINVLIWIILLSVEATLRHIS